MISATCPFDSHRRRRAASFGHVLLAAVPLNPPPTFCTASAVAEFAPSAIAPIAGKRRPAYADWSLEVFKATNEQEAFRGCEFCPECGSRIFAFIEVQERRLQQLDLTKPGLTLLVLKCESLRSRERSKYR